jgi:hypothetical protein
MDEAIWRKTKELRGAGGIPASARQREYSGIEEKNSKRSGFHLFSLIEFPVTNLLLGEEVGERGWD